jgi:hypothetical protein
LSCKIRCGGPIATALTVLVLLCAPAFSFHSVTPDEALDKGNIEVSLRKKEGINFVVGKVLINEPPQKVWPVITNPYEFLGKISPRMRQVNVLVDKTNYSLLKCCIHIGFFIPDINYVVASQYLPVQRIFFKRVGGDLKDFRGMWDMEPSCDGAKTILVYSMYIDPGIPVPQWIIREGVKGELPRFLMAVRERVKSVYIDHKALESHTILAANSCVNTQ